MCAKIYACTKSVHYYVICNIKMQINKIPQHQAVKELIC